MRRRRSLVLVPVLLALAACAPDFSRSPTALRPLPAGDPVEPRLEDDRIVMADGAALRLRAWLPVDSYARAAPIRAVIVALHGFNDHSTAFQMPAEVWQRAGIATYAYDQRGFGANPDPGRWPGSATLTADCATAVAVLRRRYPDLPVYLLGESMGGAVALAAVGGGPPAARARPDGVILASPAVWARSTMPLPNRLALWAAARLIPSSTFTGEDLGVLASDNFPMLRRLGRDPLFIKATRVDAIYGVVDLMDQALAAAAGDRLPTLVLYGAHDEVIPPEPLHRLLAALPAGAGARLAYFPAGWHMILRDIEYPVVAEDVATWIFAHDAPLPSGADRAGRGFEAGGARDRAAAANKGLSREAGSG